MDSSNSRTLRHGKLAIVTDLIGSLLWFFWQFVRLPLLLFLMILEPVVTFVGGLLALLGVLMSLGLGAALVAYHSIIRLLTR